MNIDELALDISQQISPDGWLCGSDPVLEFIHEFLKQYEADQGESVAFIHRFQSGDNLSWFGESSDFASKADWLSMAPLFLRPDPRVKELEGQHTKDGVLIFQLDKANRGLEAELARLKAENTEHSTVRQEYFNILTARGDEIERLQEIIGTDVSVRKELERQLAETTKAMEFNFEQYQDAGRLLNEECKKTEALTSQLAEARKDADRMDYLNKVSTTDDGKFKVWAAWEGGHKTLREAIDAAKGGE